MVETGAVGGIGAGWGRSLVAGAETEAAAKEDAGVGGSAAGAERAEAVCAADAKLTGFVSVSLVAAGRGAEASPAPMPEALPRGSCVSACAVAVLPTAGAGATEEAPAASSADLLSLTAASCCSASSRASFMSLRAARVSAKVSVGGRGTVGV